MVNGNQVPKPTPAEIRAQQSFPADIRERPLEEIRAGQTFGGGASRPSVGLPVQDTRAQERAKAQEQTRIRERGREIDTSFNRETKRLQSQFSRSIRNLDRNQIVQGRLELTRNLATLRDSRLAEKVQAGVIKSARSSTGQTISPSTASRFIETRTKAPPSDIKKPKGKDRQQRLLNTPFAQLTFVERLEKRFLETAGKGDLSPVLLPFEKTAKKLVETSIKLTPDIKSLEGTFLGKKVPKQVGVDITRDFLLFAFFNPAFATATAKKGGQTASQILKEEGRFGGVTRESIGGKFENLFKKKGKIGVQKKLDELSNLLKKQTNPKIRKRAIENTEKILTDLKKKNIIEGFVLDTNTGQITLLREGRPIISQAFRSGKFPTDIVLRPDVPGIRGVGVIGASEKNVLRVQEALQKNADMVARAKLTPSQRIELDTKTKTITRQRTSLSNLQKLDERTIQKQRARAIQIQAQPLGQRFKTAQAQILRTIQIQKQVQKSAKPFRIVKKIPKLKKFPFPIPFPIPKGKKKPSAKKLTRKQMGFDSLIRVKKRFIKANLRPLTAKKARDLGAFVADRSLAATFKIKRAKQLAQKPIRKVPLDFFKKNRQKFRAFKRRKGSKIPFPAGAIERRKFRLDSRSEVKKIKAAKFIKGLKRRRVKKRK